MKKILHSALILTAVTQLYAADIIIAPPPIEYSPLSVKGSQASVQLNYLSYDTDDYDMTGYGAGLSYRIKNAKDSFHNISFSYLYVDGDSSTSSQTSETDVYNLAYQYGKNLTDELIGFIGASLNYSSLSSEVPYGSTSGSDIYVDTTIYAASAGLQYEYGVSFGTLIPWVAGTYIAGGTSDVETYTYGPGGGKSTSSVDVDSFAAYQLGFDIYFDAIATSLSTMYQSSSDGDMTSINLSYNF